MEVEGDREREGGRKRNCMRQYMIVSYLMDLLPALQILGTNHSTFMEQQLDNQSINQL